MLAGFYALYVIAVAIFKPEAAPALPPEERDIPGAELLRQVVWVLLPPLALILVVLGSIFASVATRLNLIFPWHAWRRLWCKSSPSACCCGVW